MFNSLFRLHSYRLITFVRWSVTVHACPALSGFPDKLAWMHLASNLLLLPTVQNCTVVNNYDPSFGSVLCAAR